MNKVKIAFYAAIILGAAYRIYRKVTAPSEVNQARFKFKEARIGDEVTRKLEAKIKERERRGGMPDINPWTEHQI